MHSNWFETLQNVFQDGPEGAAIRHHLIETVRQHIHSSVKQIEAPPMPTEEEEEISAEPEAAEPRGLRSGKMRRLRNAYKIKELLSKPVALQDDKF